MNGTERHATLSDGELCAVNSLLMGLLVTDSDRHIGTLARWLCTELPCSDTATPTSPGVRHRYDEGIPCPLIHLAISSGIAPDMAQHIPLLKS